MLVYSSHSFSIHPSNTSTRSIYIHIVLLARRILQTKIKNIFQKKIHCPFFDFFRLVPSPQHLTLERQLNKSVLIGWNMPDPPGCQLIESYHVYVDGVLKVTVKANERTRALVEGVDLNRVSGDWYPVFHSLLFLSTFELTIFRVPLVFFSFLHAATPN